MATEQHEVVLTLSPGEYADLADDLAQLRKAGAATNTEAILEAVREKAASLKSPEQSG